MDKSKPARWPDLFSTSRNGGNDSRRILARLENSGKTQSPSALLARLHPRHLALGLAALAVLAAAVAWATYCAMDAGGAAGKAPPFRLETGTALELTPLQPRLPAPQETAPQAATIVSEQWQAPAAGQPVVAGAAVDAGAGTRGVAEHGTGVMPAGIGSVAKPGTSARSGASRGGGAGFSARPAAPIAAISTRRPVPATADEPATRSFPQRMQQNTARTADDAPAPAQAPPDMPAFATAAGAPLQASSQQEREIALLSALIVHGLVRQPSTAQQNTSEPGAAMRSAAQQDEGERRKGETTEAALQRCRRLDSTGASLCRAKICNGQWLHDAACRVPVDD